MKAEEGAVDSASPSEVFGGDNARVVMVWCNDCRFYAHTSKWVL